MNIHDRLISYCEGNGVHHTLVFQCFERMRWNKGSHHPSDDTAPGHNFMAEIIIFFCHLQSLCPHISSVADTKPALKQADLHHLCT